MSDGKVIPFVRPATKDDGQEEARRLFEADRGKPILILDPATGLYSIVVDSVVVYYGLDPIGRREEIRQAALKGEP